MKKSFFVFLLVVFLFASCSKKADQPEAYPVLGRDAVTNVSLFENHSEAFMLWAEKGYRDMTLVHVSSHDDMEFIPDEKINRIKRLVKRQKWDELQKGIDAGEKGLLKSSNYLYPAIRLGIVEKIYWVIPFRLLEYSDSEKRIRLFLTDEMSRFRADEINSMRLKDGCVSGRLFKTEVNICSADTLPFIREPVLLNIDADFSPVFSSAKGYTGLRGVKEFFDAMLKKQMRIVHAGVAFSQAYKRVKPIYRHLAEHAADALKDTKILKEAEPPRRWGVRDMAEAMLSGGNFEEALKFLEEPLKEYPDDLFLIMLNSIALADKGQEAEALDALSEICRKDKGYCYALLYLGTELSALNKFDASEMLFKKALEIKPGWAEAMFQYGDMLYARKDYEGALRLYEESARIEDDMYLQMYIGDCYYFLNKKDEALRHYEDGMSMYVKMIGYLATERNQASLDRMFEIYDKKGDRVKSGKLKQLLGIK